MKLVDPAPANGLKKPSAPGGLSNSQASGHDEHSKILFTGYLEKQNPINSYYYKRFVVLTLDAIYWFDKHDNNSLFGEEKGHIGLGSILTVRVLDEEDATIFELQDVDGRKRLFRSSTHNVCEEWVSAIRSATRSFAGPKLPVRLGTLRIPTMFDHSNYGSLQQDPAFIDVSVLLVSIRSFSPIQEKVIARSPAWERSIIIPRLRQNESVVISVSNGGTVVIPADVVAEKAEDGIAFEQHVQGVTLASSLRLSTFPAGENSQSTVRRFNRAVQQPVAGFDLMQVISEALTANPDHAVLFVLAAMVMIVAISSLRFVSYEMGLFYALAITLAVQNIYFVVRDNKSLNRDGNHGISSGQTYRLILHGHMFTSPEAPIIEPEDEVPKRFIDGCNGDLKEARQRWDITRRWRETEGVNTILEAYQPHFFTIKSMFPHYHAGIGKLGHFVYYERPGYIEFAQLQARGITADQQIRHWLFVTEYTWQIMCHGDETAKSISVIDVDNVGMADLGGEKLEILKKTIGFANAHYPERSYVIFIVNAPVWFSMLWRLVKPLVNENTQRKVRILSRKETLSGLQEHIDIEQIPVYYGGKLDFGGGIDSCRVNSPQAKEICDFVRRLNSKFADEPISGSNSASCPLSPDDQLLEGPLSSGQTQSYSGDNYSFKYHRDGPGASTSMSSAAADAAAAADGRDRSQSRMSISSESSQGPHLLYAATPVMKPIASKGSLSNAASLPHSHIEPQSQSRIGAKDRKSASSATTTAASDMSPLTPESAFATTNNNNIINNNRFAANSNGKRL